MESDRRRDPEKRQMVITTGSWVRAIIVVAVALALFALRDLILVVLTAIVIASAIEPAAVWAKRKHIPRVPSVLTIYILSALVIIGLFYFLFLPLLGEFSNFLKVFPQYSANIGSSGLFSQASKVISVPDILGQINAMLSTFAENAFSSISAAFGGILSLVIIVVLSFYLAVQEDGVEKFLRIITPWKQERYVVGLWKRSQAKIGLWMQGQILLAAIIGVLVYLGLLLVGVPNALLLATAAAIFEIVPLFGPIISAIPAVLIAFSSLGMAQALVVIGLFLIIHQFENQLIYPLVVKKVVGVPPMVSILALLVGIELAGFLGLVISVPVAAVLMEFLSDLEQEKVAKLSKIKSESPS